MQKNENQSRSSMLIFLGIVCFLFVAFFLITYGKKKAEFEKHEAMIKETNECLAAYDWKCAERNVRQLLTKSPNDTNLRVHLAEILFEQERYNECVEYIESLEFRNENLDYLVEKSKLLERDMEILGVEKSMHFRLEFDTTPTQKEVMEALAVLEVAYDSISGLFDFIPENKVGVVLYAEKEYQGVGPRPDWVMAVFDGKLRVPVNLMVYREIYRPVLFHELTHVFIRAMARSSVPLWMNEGIAQVVDASHNDAVHPQGAKPSLKMLMEPFVNKSNTEDALKLYWYSRRMVEELLWRDGGGVPAFRKFAKCIQKLQTMETDQMLMKCYGRTANDLLESIQ